MVDSALYNNLVRQRNAMQTVIHLMDGIPVEQKEFDDALAVFEEYENYENCATMIHLGLERNLCV